MPVADTRRALEEAAELQAACFIIVVGGLPEGSCDLADAREQFTEGIGWLLKDARRHGVEAAGYQGPVEVEVFSRDNWWQRPPQDVLRTCAERLQQCC
ncbi:hypothetical protein [Pseudomonas sp. KU43P]|uniref:hypothetical protein n=1 Tax=Pseudomonas sp. KU43P TaxID=2487887 RepID=UPI0012AA1B50|nr:hypothetical protein [Pseudomonas sp. KU43P]BBH46515.1 hypothetical protein KU43P_29920 [Pseudomonas sp. KU43P]